MQEKTGRVFTRVAYDTWMKFWRRQQGAKLSVRMSIAQILSVIEDDDIQEFVYLATGRIFAELKHVGLPAVPKLRSFVEQLTPTLKAQSFEGKPSELVKTPRPQIDERSPLDWTLARQAFATWMQNQPEPSDQQLELAVTNIQNIEVIIRHQLLEFATMLNKDQGGHPETVSLIDRFRIIELIDSMRKEPMQKGVSKTKAEIYKKVASKFGVTPRTIKRIDLDERKPYETTTHD